MHRIVHGALALATIALLSRHTAQAASSQLGDVAFDTSCTATAQTPFLRGLALLHDFEYGDSFEAFAAAAKADPDCAMAYWGEAMTFNHPLWRQQDQTSARAALTKLDKAAASRPPSPREAAYIQAVKTLYGQGTKEDRDFLYADAMAALHARYPDDVDATAFYALSLLGTSHGGRDIPTYMKAAAALEDVFPTHPRHPGVLHYMIHSYDDPAHAPLGMRAARLYGTIAANAPHAVHMTSHIFIALGLWDDVIAANEAAIHAVNARVPKGGSLYACGHYPEWLVYGHLQERRFAEAETAIANCRTVVDANLAKHPQLAFPDMSPVQSEAGMLVRQSIETGIWNPASVPPMEDGAFVEARFDETYAAALAARNDPARLHAALTELHHDFGRLHAEYGGDTEMQQDVQFWSVMLEECAALELASHGDTAGAIAALRTAAQHETSIPTEFGPPAVPKPPYELLGETLLKSGKASEAAAAFRAALVRAPGRTLSLQGLVAAENAMGEAPRAAAAKALLARYVR
jgi:hypothetical protein